MSNKNVRLITKKESIEVLKQLLEKVDEKALIDIINSADIKQEHGDIVYLGWNSLMENCVKLLEGSMIELEDQELSYRLTIIGDSIEEIEELHYTSPEDDEKDIPYPSIIRSFDEKDMEEQLKGYENYIKRSLDKEMSDYEPSI